MLFLGVCFPAVCTENIHVVYCLLCDSSKEGIQEVIRFNASLSMESNEGLPRVCANLPMGSMLHVNCLWMFLLWLEHARAMEDIMDIYKS